VNEVLKEIVPWLSLAVAVAALGYAIHQARSKRIQQLEQIVSLMPKMADWVDLDRRTDVLEDRATKLEGHLNHLPDKDVTHRLELSIRDLKAEVGMLSERMKPVSAVAHRLQEVILERAQASS
jgi:hypothetical protein